MNDLSGSAVGGSPSAVSSAPSAAPTRPLALFVLGMARSGTSALTRVLSLCGGSLPPQLIGADVSNPLGLWEPRKAIDINETILYRQHSGWADPTMRLQEDGGFDPKQKATSIREIGAFFRTLPKAPVVVIKEPRITLLSNLWFEAARQSGFDVAAVIAVRHPQEVAASLATRDRATPLSNALWLKYSLLAERQTRGQPRVFVEYANLLEDWRREVTRISSALGINLETRDEAAIEEFLKPDLRRQRNSGSATNLFGTVWISQAFDAMCAAADGEPLDESLLDRVFEAYTNSERDFRAAVTDFRDHFSLNNVLLRTVLRPSVLNGIRTVFYTATRLGIDPYRRRYAKQRRLSEAAVGNGSKPSLRIAPQAEKVADSCTAHRN